MVRILALINVLSLDVVAGAVISAAFFAHYFQVPLNPYSVVVLGISVWLIYTADHLKDAFDLQGREASTFRHRFHQVHFNTLLIVSAALLMADILLVSLTQRHLFAAGGALALAVVLYLVANRSLNGLKELSAAPLYTAGILMPVCTHIDLLTPATVVVILSFLINAWLNLMIFSIYDELADRADFSVSFVQRYGLRRAYTLVYILYLLSWLGNAYLYIEGQGSAAAVLLAMSTALFMLLQVRSRVGGEGPFRMLGDAIFLFPVVYLI